MTPTTDLAWLHKKARSAVEDALAADESVKALYRGPGKETLACTDRRVLLVKQRGTRLQTNSYRYNDIASVQVTVGGRVMNRQSYLELTVPGVDYAHVPTSDSLRNTVEMLKRPNVFLAGVGATGQAAVKEAQTTLNDMIEKTRHAPGQAANDRGSVIGQIEKLGELHHQGVLTAEEFESKKRELLDRL